MLFMMGLVTTFAVLHNQLIPDNELVDVTDIAYQVFVCRKRAFHMNQTHLHGRMLSISQPHQGLA